MHNFSDLWCFQFGAAVVTVPYITTVIFVAAPPEGERKLYLAIESTLELAVQKAKVEITRLLKVSLMFLVQTYHVLL